MTAVNGVLKLVGVFDEAGESYPYYDVFLDKVIDFTRDFTPGTAAECWNPFGAIYEQYKDSDNEEKQGWAEQAKMRANKTASTYNNYILENNYVWSGNVPSDICGKLPYLE